MYNFIFNFFYRYHKEGKSFGPRSTAALAVAMTIFVQLFMAVTILKYFARVDIFSLKPFSKDYFTNKLFYMPFMVAYGFLFVRYYTHKRAMAILNKYPKDYKLLTVRNIILVVLISALPAFIGIQILIHCGKH